MMEALAVPLLTVLLHHAAGGGGLGWLAAFIPALVLVVGLAVWSRFK